MQGTVEKSKSEDGPVVQENQISVALAVTGGLAPGAKLRANRMINLSQTGLVFSGEPTQEQWKDIGAALVLIKTTYHLAMADWITYGRAKFGDDVVESTMMQLEFDLVDARQAVMITAMSMSARHPALKTEHYAVLCCNQLTPVEQDHWSMVTVSHKLTPAMLKISIVTGRVVSEKTMEAQAAARNSGIANLPGMRQSFDIWFIRAQDIEPMDKWTTERKREVWKDLEAPTKLGMKLANELGIKLEEEGT